MRARETRFTGQIIHYESRRRWWREILFFVAALLVCWLLSGCQMHGETPPWMKGAVLGLCTFGLVVVLFKVALWIKRRDDEALDCWSVAYSEDEGQWDLASPPPCRPGSGRVRPTNTPPAPAFQIAKDPLDLPFMGIDLASMIRITDALIKQTEGAAMWVESASKTLCRHEQEDMLRMALRDLQPVNDCLPELKKALQKQQQTGRALV